MAGAIGAIFTLMRAVNSVQDSRGLSAADAALVIDALSDADRIAGFMQCCAISRLSQEERKKIEELVSQREEARKRKEWERADAIREQIREMGIEVIDTASGPRWRTVALKREGTVK